MQRVVALSIIASTLLSVSAPPARSESAAERGEAVYKQCAVCHSLKEGVTLAGPSLLDLIGRKAASVDSFTYSDAMYSADFVWDDEHLAKWVRDAQSIKPGVRMPAIALSNEDMAALIAYLETLK